MRGATRALGGERLPHMCRCGCRGKQGLQGVEFDAASRQVAGAAGVFGLQSGCPPCQRAGIVTVCRDPTAQRSEEHTSELQSLMRISYAVFCLKKKTNIK